jgi:hypothetical protein
MGRGAEVMPEFALRDMNARPGFDAARSLCVGCGQSGDGPYVDLGVGLYGSDLTQKPGVGIRYLCRACIGRVAQAVGFVLAGAVEQSS